MKTVLCFSAIFLLNSPDICSAETMDAPRRPEIRGFCSKCPKHENPMDCTELMENGVTESGVYTIYPRARIIGDKFVDVYCDMETNGGGWTVIQRRGQYGNPEDYFVRTWKEYGEGFGDLEKEFWIGNKYIYSITHQGEYAIRFEMLHGNGTWAYTRYENFWIENEEEKYKLRVSEASGTAGDALTGHGGRNFYASDQPNLEKPNDPPRSGGWWVNYLYTSSLNGLNLDGKPGPYFDGITWWTFGEYSSSLKATEIKLRPKRFIKKQLLKKSRKSLIVEKRPLCTNHYFEGWTSNMKMKSL